MNKTPTGNITAAGKHLKIACQIRTDLVGKMSSHDVDALELQNSATYQGTDEDDGQYYPTTHSHHSGVYETKYQKSLRHYLTREALPKESHYRNLNSIVADGSNRPTLEELHDNTLRAQVL